MPAGPMQLSAAKGSMRSAQIADVTAGKDAITLTVYPELKIFGNVVDAQTHLSIPEFSISYGMHFPIQGPDDVAWQEATRLANGKYEANIGSFSTGGKLQRRGGRLPSGGIAHDPTNRGNDHGRL